MTLDEQDRKLVEQLRNEVKSWPVKRWGWLLIALILVAFGIVRDEAFPAVVGAGAIAYTIQYWCGNPTSILLLRLLERKDSQAE